MAEVLEVPTVTDDECEDISTVVDEDFCDDIQPVGYGTGYYSAGTYGGV